MSLLARLELAGVAVGDRCDELAGHLAGRSADQVQLFLDLQHLYGLAHALGMLNPAQADWRGAADALGAALPGLASIGGSHAQRDLFEQLHIDALQRAGQLSAVQNLLQPHANAQPQSRRLRRRLHTVYTGLRLPSLATA